MLHKVTHCVGCISASTPGLTTICGGACTAFFRNSLIVISHGTESNQQEGDYKAMRVVYTQ